MTGSWRNNRNRRTLPETERLRDRCELNNYSSPHGHAIYPKNTKVETLLPILEFAYKKHQGH